MLPTDLASAHDADRDLRRAFAEFTAAAESPASSAPLLLGLARTAAALARCLVGTALDGGRDPMDLRPLVLR